MSHLTQVRRWFVARRRWFPARLTIVLLACVVSARSGYAGDSQPSEEQVKAAFISNFPKYVDWPADFFSKADSPIILATLGTTRLDDEIQAMVRGKTCQGRPLVFKHVTLEMAATNGCQVLFIEASQPGSANVLKSLECSNVLTVGESEHFLEDGGVINLALRGRKIRLQVNLTAAESADLKISSKLLSVAHEVQGKTN